MKLLKWAFKLTALWDASLAAWWLWYLGLRRMTWTDGTPIPLPAAWFNNGDESYGALMRNGNHWLWELTLSLSEIVIVDILIVAVLWPLLMRHLHRDAPHKKRDDIPTLWSKDTQKTVNAVIGKRRRSEAAKKGWQTRRENREVTLLK